jgi:hypothetical protein
VLVGFFFGLVAKVTNIKIVGEESQIKILTQKVRLVLFICIKMSLLDFEAGRKVVEIKHRAVMLTTRIRSLKRLFPNTLADNSSLV